MDECRQVVMHRKEIHIQETGEHTITTSNFQMTEQRIDGGFMISISADVQVSRHKPQRKLKKQPLDKRLPSR